MTLQCNSTLSSGVNQYNDIIKGSMTAKFWIARNHTSDSITHIDDVSHVSGLQVVEDTSFVQVGQQRHVGTTFELGGIHGLTVVDVRCPFLKIIMY